MDELEKLCMKRWCQAFLLGLLLVFVLECITVNTPTPEKGQVTNTVNVPCDKISK